MPILPSIILLAAAAAAQPAREQPVTFTRDVAPIVFRSCAPCHHPQGAAPFPLLDYTAVRRRARQIADVTGSGYMPPWLPADVGAPLADSRRLAPEEIALIRNWVAAGAPRGDDADLPPVPRYGGEWALGEPDLVLSLPRSFPLPADGRDIYRNFVIAPGVARPRWVRAVDFKPSDPKLVHHARFAVDTTPDSRRRQGESKLPGYPGMDLGNASNPDGHLLGWAPGRRPYSDPRMSWQLRPGTDILVQLHMVPSGKPEQVNGRLALYFSDEPPSLRPYSLALATRDIDIPAGARDYEVRESYRIPVAVDALAVAPHAHYVGKTMHVTAALPDGTATTLLHIDDWDFNWQDEYRYARPVPLPAGTRIEMRYTFDNSRDNPRNPTVPPQRVRYGPQTTDEMAELILQVVPRDPAEWPTLERDYRRQHVEKAIGYRERRLLEDPREFASLEAVGSSYLELERPAEAVPYLEQALAVRPTDMRARNNLAYALEQLGQPERAEGHYRRAARDDPPAFEPRNNLARLLYRTGRWRDARGWFEQALALRPDEVQTLTDLAWLLATHPDAELRDPARALDLARRAERVSDSTEPIVLSTLAAALARTGDFPGATAQAERALRMAESRGATSLARTIGEHLARYGKRQPIVSTGAD